VSLAFRLLVLSYSDNLPYTYCEQIGKEIRDISDEIPFEIPDSWEWCRFGTIMVNRDSERIPLSVAEREKLDKIYDYYGASGVIDKVDKYLFNKPLLLIGEDGANLLLRSKPIAFIAKGEYWVNNHAHVLDTIGGLYMEYICAYINAMVTVQSLHLLYIVPIPIAFLNIVVHKQIKPMIYKKKDCFVCD
jgi:hypothetical protein